MGEVINKKVKAKVVHKHETAANWEQSNYIPDVGEIVFYDPDETHNYTRQKNGDGVNMVKDLPFSAPQADWKQTDETAPDYIKNKLGLELGEAPKTTQQPGSLAISEGATAFGDHTFAGLKAFEVIGWDDANNTYTLKTPLPEDISTGTSYSSQIKNNYYKCGEITSISTDRLVIGVTNYKSPTGVAINEYHYIWFTDYPTYGDLDIGKNATAIGKDNFAIQDNTVAIGRENRSIGKNAVTLGRNNEAYYSAFAVGHSNKALNAEAIAMGALNEATGACSVAIGYSSKSEGQDSFAGGRNTKAVGKAAFAYGNTATAEAPNSVAFGQNSKATSEGQFVIGDNTIDNNATMIVAKNNQNIFTVNNDGTASVLSEPQKPNDVATKGFVETHTNSFDTRIEALESGYLLFEQNSNIIEFDSTSEGYALIKSIGGNSVEGVNKVNPQKLYNDERHNTFEVNGDTITLHFSTTGGSICLAYKLQVKANTEYRIKFNINGTSVDGLDRTLKYVYIRSDPNNLWGGTTLKSFGISSNSVDVVYNSDSDREVAFCLYRTNINEENYDEYISNLMITEGTDQDSYVPYMMVPTKVTQITSYDSDGNSIDTYSTPSSILDLPAFGHGIGNSYNAIDFADKIYTQVTNDGISVFNNVIITDVSDKVDEMPKLKVASNGKLQVTTSTGANVNLFIFYKKDAESSNIEVIDNLDSTNSTAALSANMGRELNEKIRGYVNTYSEEDGAYNAEISIGEVFPSGGYEILKHASNGYGNWYETNIGAFLGGGYTSEIKMYRDADLQSIDLLADEVRKNGKEIATEDYVDNAIENIPAQVQADWNETDISDADYIKNKPGLSAGPGKHHLVAADGYLAGKASYTSQVINGSSMEYDDLYGHYVFEIPYPENHYYCSVDIFHENGDLWYQNASLNTISSDWDCSAWINGIYFTNPYPLEDLAEGNFYFTITNNSTPPNWLIEGANLTITRSDGGEYGLAIGENIENGGNCNLLVGQGLIHKGNNALIIGQYNDQDSNALLQVGSGTSSYPKNALSVTSTKTVAPRMQVTNLTPNSDYELTTKYYVEDKVNTHANNTNVHVTAEEKQKWNNMANGGGGSSNKLERIWLPAGYSDDCYAESISYDISFHPDNTHTHYYYSGMNEYGNQSTGDMFLTVSPQANVFVNIEDSYNVSWYWDDTLIISAIDPYYTLEIEVITYEHWDVAQCTIFIYTTNANPGAATKLQ